MYGNQEIPRKTRKMADPDVKQNADDTSGGFLSSIVSEVINSPLNLILVAVCAFLLYRILTSRRETKPATPVQTQLPPLKKRDFTLEQLREYDGKGKDGRVLVAVNGKVFDVTRGKRFYGPGGPYGVFAGHDASRGLATFSLTEDAVRDEYDDLTDLNSMQMESVNEWEMQFKEKYDYVGKLLRPGEQATDYTDTEDEPEDVISSAAGQTSNTTAKSKDN